MAAPAQSNPKQQHYVQRAYLEGFVDPDSERSAESYLWAYLPNKLPFPQKPDRIARRNYYYCFDKENRRQFVFEHTLQKLEDISLPVLRKLRNQQFNISPEERLTFAGYVALSYTRVPTFEGVINKFTLLYQASEIKKFASDAEKMAALAREESERTGIEVSPEEVRGRLTGGTVYLTQTNRGWSLQQMVKVMMLVQTILFDMSWTFLISPDGDQGFLTSDNPVSLFAPGAVVPSVGILSSPNSYLTFPISRDVCFHAKHRPGVPQATKSVTAAQVREVNKGTIGHADTQLYAPFRSHRVQDLLNSMMSARGTPKRVTFKHGLVVEE